MENLVAILLLLLLLAWATSPCSAYNFYVGGRDGWVLRPKENYTEWAGRNRFQVGDTLVFKYNKGEDSVLVVDKGHYESCNTSNPIRKMDGGDSVFQLGRSGPFYFVSGVAGNCGKGQKLTVVVLSVRPAPPPFFPQPPASSPAPTAGAPPAGPASGGSSLRKEWAVAVGLVGVAFGGGLFV